MPELSTAPADATPARTDELLTLAFESLTVADVLGLAEAADASYDNATSGLAATKVQAAIDEIAAGSGGSGNTVTTVTSVAGVVTLDLSLGVYFKLTMTENVTSLLFTNLPGSGKGASATLAVTQDTTPRTFAWPASFKWVAGSAGAISTGSGARDRLFMTTDNNGTAWDASLAKAWG